MATERWGSSQAPLAFPSKLSFGLGGTGQLHLCSKIIIPHQQPGSGDTRKEAGADARTNQASQK